VNLPVVQVRQYPRQQRDHRAAEIGVVVRVARQYTAVYPEMHKIRETVVVSVHIAVMIHIRVGDPVNLIRRRPDPIFNS
jgi:hypothetical protein